MKSSSTRLRILAAVALASLILISFRSTDDQVTAKQVLLVEVYWDITKVGGIYIFHNDKPTEVLGVEQRTKQGIESNARLMTKKLQELYDQGWQLEGVVGDQAYQRFVLTK